MTPGDFSEFFEALWGYPPFDWQTRLLKCVVERGWPATLDLPTGAGKTATLDIAIFALALDVARAPAERNQPRRIVLVVDRRVVVDQGFERACSIAKKLAEAKDGILAEVAAALRKLSGDVTGLPLLPAILRGGMPRESEWAKSPSQPVILTSTVDQVGSRLLFRGYGVAERMRPVHAGLLGCDTLLLLDEVHLARPFEETLSAVARWYCKGEASSFVRPLQFVRMSATVASTSHKPFGLEEKDWKNPCLEARLVAAKLALLRPVTTPRDPAKATEALAVAALREVERLSDTSARAIAVIVNRVETARRIASLASQRLGDTWTVSLLTGRMRALDRLDRQAAVLEHVRAGRERTAGSTRVLVVSTQALEAGADFDFDALVTECASLDALRQRFGRLDRLGELKRTDAVILVGTGSVDERAEPDPIYGTALKETWRFLNDAATRSVEQDVPFIDFGITAMNSLIEPLKAEQMAALSAPREVAPILTASHLDRWVQTSPAPHADPAVNSFLHGIGRGSPEVQIVWRADLSDSLMSAEFLPLLQEMLDLARPSSLEALSVPLWAAAKWLAMVGERGRTKEAYKDGELLSVGDVEGGREGFADDSPIAPVLVWRGGDTALVTDPSGITPGATLVVPSSYGGLDGQFGCWSPESEIPVSDRGDEAQLLQKGRAVVRWHPDVLATWAPALACFVKSRLASDAFRAELIEDGEAAERELFHELRSMAETSEDTPAWAKVALGHLARGSRTVRVELGTTASYLWRAQTREARVPAGKLRKLLGLPELRNAMTSEVAYESATEEDEGSFLGSVVSLTRHLNGVRSFAEGFGAALNLPREVTNDLALAGLIHDLGKADPRFQLLLHGGDPVKEAAAHELLAKSAVPSTDHSARERARERSGYPRGMRHELLSVALAERSPSLRAKATDWDLVLHLVASHHGWCRPFAPPVHDPAPQTVTLEFLGETLTASSDHGLERFNSSVPERFWMLVRKYGYWGLAWLEAVLRLADHRESEKESRKDEPHG